MSLLEIACFDPQSAILASEAGADRIELCDDKSQGGVSPPLEWLQLVKARVSVPIFVMIRPRGGDFHYSPAEFDHMRADLARFKEHGADGFVLGILDESREIDADRTTELVRHAHPLPCTFHRAFDDARSPMQALDRVIATGCRAILTSGGAPSAGQGVDLLRSLMERAAGRIDIIPGGGVRSSNLPLIRTATRATVFHSAAALPGTSLPDATEIHQMQAHLAHSESLPELAAALSSTIPYTVSEPSAADDDSMSYSAVSIGR